MGFSTKSKKSAILERLEKCLAQRENQLCADCGEEKPQWASILLPPVSGGRKMGVFCCYKCCSYHFQMGRGVCSVKNLKIAEDWTEQEVKALETSGNAISNAIFEGMIGTVFERPTCDDHDAQAHFVESKYKGLKFFCKRTYESHSSWFSSNEEQTSSHRRSFEDITRSISLANTPVPKARNSVPTAIVSTYFAETEPMEQQNSSPFPSEDALGYNDNRKAPTPSLVDLGYGSADGTDEDLYKCLANRTVDRRYSMDKRGSLGHGRRGSVGAPSRRDSVGQPRPGRRGSVGAPEQDVPPKRSSKRSELSPKRSSKRGSVGAPKQELSPKRSSSRGSVGAPKQGVSPKRSNSRGSLGERREVRRLERTKSMEQRLELMADTLGRRPIDDTGVGSTEQEQGARRLPTRTKSLGRRQQNLSTSGSTGQLSIRRTVSQPEETTKASSGRKAVRRTKSMGQKASRSRSHGQLSAFSGHEERPRLRRSLSSRRRLVQDGADDATEQMQSEISPDNEPQRRSLRSFRKSISHTCFDDSVAQSAPQIRRSTSNSSTRRHEAAMALMTSVDEATKGAKPKRRSQGSSTVVRSSSKRSLRDESMVSRASRSSLGSRNGSDPSLEGTRSPQRSPRRSNSKGSIRRVDSGSKDLEGFRSRSSRRLKSKSNPDSTSQEKLRMRSRDRRLAASELLGVTATAPGAITA